MYLYVENTNLQIDPFGLFDWGGLLRKLTGTEPPIGMENPHAHHIVFKKGRGSQLPIVNQSKAILEKYDIDWLKGKENLVWAPNTKDIHTKETAQKVLDALKVADAKGTRKAVVDALSDLGKKFADKSICN